MASIQLKLSTMKVEVENSSDVLLACRICLASDVKLFNIRECGLDQVFVDLMGTTLSAWDGFPQHLCYVCRALLVRGQELRARCRRAEQLLKQALMHQHFITQSFINSIDRNAHKLTHGFSHDSINRFSNDSIIYDFNHDDIQTDTQKPNPRWEVLVENDIEMDIKDFDDDDDDDDDDNNSKFSPNLDKLQDCPKDSVTPEHTPEINTVERSDTTIKTDRTILERNVVTLEHTPEINTVESSNRTIKTDRISLKRKVVTPEHTPEINTVERSNTTIKTDRTSLKRKMVTNKTETKKKPTPRKKKKGLNGDHPRLKPFYNKEHYKKFEEKYKINVMALSEEEMVRAMEARKESDSYKKSDFKCESCFKGFFSSTTYANHMKSHDPARPHVCRFCSFRYFTPASLRRHMQSSHELKFTCLQCNQNISSKESAELHAAFHAGTTFKCNHCDQQFLKKTSRSTHMRLRHPKEIADGGTCEQCGETFLSGMGLRRHQAWTHKGQTFLPHLRCRWCKIRFESEAAIDRHRDTQPGGKCDNKHSSCSQCGEACPTEQELLTHRMQQHGLQLFTCDMCGKSFESKDSVRTHMDRVHFLKPPKPGLRNPAQRKAAYATEICEHCGKGFPNIWILKIHMYSHTGERPHKCPLCPKTYKTAQGLKAHEPFHTGARKWRCTECDASYLHQSSLYQHRRSLFHKGDKAKTYQCHLCAKTFTQSGSLQTHIKYVHMKMTPPPRKRNKKTA